MYMDKSSPEYKKAKREADKKFKEKTSAYKSLWIVKRYKELGGRYRKAQSKGRLKRWVREKWVRIDPKTGRPMRRNGRLVPCGRSEKEKISGSKKGLCRPYKRMSKGTPKTAKQLGSREMRTRARLKRKHPDKVITKNHLKKRKTKTKTKRKSKRKPKRKTKRRTRTKTKRKPKRKTKR